MSGTAIQVLYETIAHMERVVGKPPIFDKWLDDLKRARRGLVDPGYRPMPEKDRQFLENLATHLWHLKGEFDSMGYEAFTIDMEDYANGCRKMARSS